MARTNGRSPGARNEKLQQSGAQLMRKAGVIRAVVEELAQSDYGGLTVEKVAARAGVNKTTVYRHWPTKPQLVRAALATFSQAWSVGPSSGTLRDDLIRVGRAMVDAATSFEGQCLIRLRLLQHPEPELAGIAKELNEQRVARYDILGEAAVKRGEVAAVADFRLLLDMLGGALHVRLVMKNETVDDVLIARIVDILLRGAQPVAKRQRKRAI